MDKVAVIILTYNALEEATKPCLESVFGCRNELPFEVVVVDNNSTDGTREYLTEMTETRANLKVVLNDENYGYAKGNNIGIKAIDASYYFLLNNDTIVTDYWLDKLCSFLANEPEVGMIGPVSNSVGNEQCIYVSSMEEADIIKEGLYWAEKCYGDFFFTTMLGFFCVGMKRELLDNVGLLDESYGLGLLEDDDYCLRSVEMGYKLACLEDVFIYHKGSLSFGKLKEEAYSKLFWNNVNRFEAKFNIEYKSRWTNGPFLKLVENYLGELTPDNASKIVYKICSKANVMQRMDFALLSIDNFKLFHRITELSTRLNDMTNQYNQSVIKLTDRDSYIESMTSQIANMTSELNTIYTSNLWMVANMLNKVVMKTGVTTLLNGLLIWKRSGFKELLRATKEYLTNKICNKAVKLNKLKKAKYTDIFCNCEQKGKVSIVLPVYNQASFLEEAIDSVLAQTYENIELIVLNDGSTDEVYTVFDKYIDNPKVILLTQENQKLPAALNNGFHFATGEFYTWTSADNIMLPNQIEVLVNYLKKHPQIGMVYSDYQAIDDRGAPLNDPGFRPQNQDTQDRSLMRLPSHPTEQNLLESGDNFIGASFLYRHYTAWVVGDYATDTFGGEDYDYWLRILNLFEIGHVRDVLYKYRVHDNTLNAKAHELKLFDIIRRMLERNINRRDFLKKTFNFIEIGTAYGLKSSQSEHTVIVISYTNLECLSATHARYDVMPFVVCVVDVAPRNISIDALKVADLIVVADKEQFDVLADKFGRKVLCLDIAKGLSQFKKLAENRFFDKMYQSTKITTQHLPHVYVNRKLNLALQVETMDKGGLEQVVYNLVRGIDRAAFNVTVIVCGESIGHLGRQLREQGYDVVSVGAREQRLEELINEKRVDIVNLHHSIWGVATYRKHGVATVYTVHNSYTWLREAQIAERREAFRNIDFFITVSNQVKDYFVARFGVPYGKTRTVPNGMDFDEFQGVSAASRSDYGLENEDFVFINVSSFNGIKFHNLMLSALKRCMERNQRVKILFVGNVLDKQYYDFLSKRIGEEGLERNVIMVDFVDRKKLGGLLKMSNAFLLPSIQEGWSNAIMEAMYFELPLILSDIGSARDIIKDNDIGIIIPNPYDNILDLSLDDLCKLAYETKPSNLMALVDAMLDICNNYEAWKVKCAEGSSMVTSMLTVSKMAEAYADICVEAKHIFKKKHFLCD